MKIFFRNFMSQIFRNTTLPVWLSYWVLNRTAPQTYMDNWAALPFNGQVRRLRFLAILSLFYRPSAVVETGTYLGSSTPYLAGLFNCPVVTFEIESKFHKWSAQRFQTNHPRVSINSVHGDSVHGLSKYLEDFSPSQKLLAYLDAHWLSEVPTSQELQLLHNWGGDWIAIIDDFKVDFDSGYKYDSYDGAVIGMAVVPPIEGIEVWVPDEASSVETSVKSGTGIVFSSPRVREEIPIEVLSLIRKVR